ncbi:MFS general substrate transporter [Mycena latifolia]|nr:MFS general substrate transporter [Mycena latifolia]
METERTPLVPKAPAEPTRLDFALLMTGIWRCVDDGVDDIFCHASILGFVFITSLDATIVATLLRTIGSSLESMQLSSWIGTAYLLSLCAFTPIYGRLIIGRRPSILLTRNMTQLIAFRALAGIGGSGMSVVGSVIVSDSVPLRSRGLYQGFASLLFGLGGALGGPLDGWLGDTIGWRAAFVCQSPFSILALFLLYFQVREPAVVLGTAGGSISAKLKRMDYPGSACIVLALVTFLVGMDFKTTAAYGPIVFRSVILTCFILIEVKFAVEAIVPMSMLKRVTHLSESLSSVGAYLFHHVNTPLYFIAARLRTATNTGAHLTSNSVCVVIGLLFAGWYMRKTGRYWRLRAFDCLCLVRANLPLASWFAATTATMVTDLIASVPRNDIPLAAGLSYLFRTMGQVLGVSLSAALTQTLLARNLRAQIVGPGAADAHRPTITKILASEYIHTLPADLHQKAAASWLAALHTVFCCQIASVPHSHLVLC